MSIAGIVESFATRPIVTMCGRVVHSGLVNHFGDYRALCGRHGFYTAAAKSDAVTCKRCLRIMEARDEPR